MLTVALPQNLDMTMALPTHYPTSDPTDPKSRLSADQLTRETCYPYLVKTFHPNNPATHHNFIRRTWQLREATQVAEAETYIDDTTLRYVKDNVAVDIIGSSFSVDGVDEGVEDGPIGDGVGAV